LVSAAQENIAACLAHRLLRPLQRDEGLLQRAAIGSLADGEG
jgi:hypothetical protein